MVSMMGCQGSLRGSSYGRQDARTMQSVYAGTVISVNHVTIEGESGPVGVLAGGATGAAVGQTIGSGRGRTAATVIGGAAGALAGAAVEKKVTTKQGIEITVKLDDGRTVAIVQEVAPEENFRPGDYVNVIQGADGTARVRPR